MSLIVVVPAKPVKPEHSLELIGAAKAVNRRKSEAFDTARFMT
jgi:hypothetical protein